jgi:hypothetical protein
MANDCGCTEHTVGCNSCSSQSCEQVLYSGPALSCSGINNHDNLCIALQKIDNTLCNPSSLSVTASNGLYKDVLLNDIRLGGPLIEATVITTSISHTLSLLNLIIDNTPEYIISQNNIGVLKHIPTTTLTNIILSQITANNGINYDPYNIQLGGILITPTVITVDSVNTLSIPGLVTNTEPEYIVTIDGTTGTLIKTLVSTILSQITADNGLTKTGNNTQFGGILLHDTEVDQDGYKMSWINGNIGIGITAEPYNIYNNLGNNNTRLKLLKTTGFENCAANSTSYAKLELYSTTSDDKNSERYSATDSTLYWLTTEDISINPTHTYASTSSYTIFESKGKTEGIGSTTENPTGVLSASTAQGTFANWDIEGGQGGDVDVFITYRAKSPTHYTGGYDGTIDNSIGILIEDQRAFILNTVGTGNITKSYGIKQSGTSDENVFNGPITSNNLIVLNDVILKGSLADDAAAAAAGVPIGGLYHTSGVIHIRLV